jgi:hypothetical protein
LTPSYKVMQKTKGHGSENLKQVYQLNLKDQYARYGDRGPSAQVVEVLQQTWMRYVR